MADKLELVLHDEKNVEILILSLRCRHRAVWSKDERTQLVTTAQSESQATQRSATSELYVVVSYVPSPWYNSTVVRTIVEEWGYCCTCTNTGNNRNQGHQRCHLVNNRGTGALAGSGCGLFWRVTPLVFRPHVTCTCIILLYRKVCGIALMLLACPCWLS